MDITNGKFGMNFLWKYHQWIQKVLISDNLDVKGMWSTQSDYVTKKSSDDKDMNI